MRFRGQGSHAGRKETPEFFSLHRGTQPGKATGAHSEKAARKRVVIRILSYKSTLTLDSGLQNCKT